MNTFPPIIIPVFPQEATLHPISLGCTVRLSAFPTLAETAPGTTTSTNVLRRPPANQGGYFCHCCSPTLATRPAKSHLPHQLSHLREKAQQEKTGPNMQWQVKAVVHVRAVRGGYSSSPPTPAAVGPLGPGTHTQSPCRGEMLLVTEGGEGNESGLQTPHTAAPLLPEVGLRFVPHRQSLLFRHDQHCRGAVCLQQAEEPSEAAARRAGARRAQKEPDNPAEQPLRETQT